VVISAAVVPLSPLLRQNVLSLAVAVTLILGASAHAADPAEVERLLQDGIRLRREGSDGRALPLFQKAHDLAHTPRTGREPDRDGADHSQGGQARREEEAGAHQRPPSWAQALARPKNRVTKRRHEAEQTSRHRDD
jgi:hypothetical protein